MHFDFRPLLRRTFAELLPKYAYPHPAISRGSIRGKAHATNLGLWPAGEASPLEARLLPMQGMVNVQSTAPHSEPNQNQSEILRHPSPAGAPGGRGW